METLQILEVATYAAFIVGALVAIYELRVMARDRKTELLVNMAEHWSSREFVEALSSYSEADFTSAVTAEKTCPKVHLLMMSEYFDSMASLIKTRAMGLDFMGNMLDFEGVWERMKPWCLHTRERINPTEFRDFEWAANECRRRRLEAEQKMKVAKASLRESP